MKVLKIVCVVICALTVGGVAYGQHSVGGWNADEIADADTTVAAFIKKDPGIKSFFEKARGYVVFPTVAKGAVGIGGAHGSGLAYEDGNLIGKAKVTQITIGFQLGGQAYSEIVFFENQKAMDRFKEGNFELAAQASAVAVTVGASADLAYSGGVAVVTMAKGGLMYEASIGGQKFSFTPAEKDE